MGKVYVGVAGKARQAQKIYVGVDGKARLVTKAYVGVDGKARQIWPSIKPLSEFAVGTILYINENGSPVPYTVSGHDYNVSPLEPDITSSITGRWSVLVRNNALDDQAVLGNTINITSMLTSHDDSLDDAIKALAADAAVAKSFRDKTRLLYLDMLGLRLTGYLVNQDVKELPNAASLRQGSRWLANTRTTGSLQLQRPYRAYTLGGEAQEAVVDNLSTVLSSVFPVLYLPGDTLFDPAGEFAG